MYRMKHSLTAKKIKLRTILIDVLKNTNTIQFEIASDEDAQFPQSERIQQYLQIRNITSSQVAFKVKTTNNNAYYVHPHIGILESQTTMKFEINCNVKAIKNSKRFPPIPPRPSGPPADPRLRADQEEAEPTQLGRVPAVALVQSRRKRYPEGHHHQTHRPEVPEAGKELLQADQSRRHVLSPQSQGPRTHRAIHRLPVLFLFR